MGTTAMTMDIACETSSHMVTPLGPNVCITPAAPSPLPIPYPIMGDTGKLDPGTEKTQDGGKKVLTTDGCVKQIHGDEAGTQKDITTGTTGGKAWIVPLMVTVMFEGAPVAVTANPGFANST